MHLFFMMENLRCGFELYLIADITQFDPFNTLRIGLIFSLLTD